MLRRPWLQGLGVVLTLLAFATLEAAQDSKKPPLREREREKAKPEKKTTPAKAGSGREAEAFKSGPQVGELIPGSFSPLNVNGKRKDRHHCLVCEYGTQPVVLVFAREPADGKDATLTALLQQLDEAVDRHPDDLHSFAVFISPDARSAATGAVEVDASKLVEEAAARQTLMGRLQARAEKLKHVVLTTFPADGPKDYKISPKAEVTVLFYSGFKVEANRAFAAGVMQPGDVKAIIKKVNDTLARPTKAPANKS